MSGSDLKLTKDSALDFFIAMIAIMVVEFLLTAYFATLGTVVPPGGAAALGMGPRQVKNYNAVMMVANACLFVFMAIMYALYSADSHSRAKSAGISRATWLVIFYFISFGLMCVSATVAWQGHDGEEWTTAELRKNEEEAAKQAAREAEKAKAAAGETVMPPKPPTQEQVADAS